MIKQLMLRGVVADIGDRVVDGEAVGAELGANFRIQPQCRAEHHGFVDLAAKNNLRIGNFNTSSPGGRVGDVPVKREKGLNGVPVVVDH